VTRPSNHRRLASTFAGAALLLAGCGQGAAPVADGGPSGRYIPRPEVLSLEQLAAAAAKPGGAGLMLNFWATWCPPCLEEMPDLATLSSEVEPKGLPVRAVSIDLAMPIKYETAAAVTAFATDFPIELPVWIFDGDLDALNEALDLPGPVPVTVVFDAEGKVTASHVGRADLATLREMASTVL